MSRAPAGAFLALLAACGQEAAAPTRLGRGGAHVWSIALGAALGQRGPALAADGGGAVATTGFFRERANLGGGALANAGRFDAFVSMHSADGEPLWSRSLGGESDDLGVAVAFDPGGDLVVAGVFEETAELGADTLTSAGAEDVFLARFSRTGDPLWSRRVGGEGTDDVSALAIDATGAIAVIGWFSGTIDLGGEPLVAAGDVDGTDLFVASYSADGEHRWSLRLGDRYSDYGSALALDPEGNLVVSGRLTWPRMDDGEVAASGNDDGVRSDILLAKLSRDGELLWERRLAGSQYASGHAVGVDALGDVVVAGSFLDRIDLGGTELVSRGNTDAFAARYSADGELLWSRHFGDECSDRASSLAVAPAGELVLVGAFECRIDLGGGMLRTERQDWDAFAVKLSAAGDHIWSQRFGADKSDRSLAVALDGAGSAVLSGVFVGLVDLGGETFETHGQEDLFLAKFAP